MCGFTDPDNRRTYPWGHEDQQMIDFHKAMIKIHKSGPEFLRGSLKPVDGEYNFIAYGRFTDTAVSLMVINNNDYEVTKNIIVWTLGVPKDGVLVRRILTDETGFTTEPVEYPLTGGAFDLTLPKTSAAVFSYRTRDESQDFEESKKKERKHIFSCFL